MLTFVCQCGNELHFANTQCVQCNYTLGFIPDDLVVSAFSETDSELWLSSCNNRKYRPCRNYKVNNVCNWMVEADDENDYCLSCRLTKEIPDLTKADNLRRWYLLERAKRRLIYAAIKLNLPIKNKYEDPEAGLEFVFREDVVEDEYGNELTIKEFVITGHNNGLITINVKEADHAVRVDMREKMKESYRTLIGHFRHESGHYYWDRLINETEWIDDFRNLFGDERLDYQEALQTYYKDGPVDEWQHKYISAYASMHPWEDWAETWAHYLHMVDTLESAHNFQVTIGDKAISNPFDHVEYESKLQIEESFTEIFDNWCSLARVLNGLNRSMGIDDAYPFIVSESSLNKLRFVHHVINRFNNNLK